MTSLNSIIISKTDSNSQFNSVNAVNLKFESMLCNVLKISLRTY